jgi:LuxR family transcriptional regulator, maltose regulon positive regulatory protein
MLLLNTKLNVPPLRPARVQRADLLQRLDKLPEHKLALIAAPAGYGKTALVSEWAAQSPYTAVWLSIDVGDNDPVRFWDYVIAAVQTTYPQMGEQTLPLLHEPQSLPIETILSTLINELAALPDLLVLVLDDYHAIESTAIHDGLEFLVEHLPAQLRLIITTRVDPPLPLARMRVRNQLIELRSADLRLSPPQISTFFNDVMGLTLTLDQVEALDQRVEGWIAGLQLAALALQGQDDAAEFIASFAGDHRYVLDYLGDELLDRQPEAVQQFLLHTSILERLNADLCDAITGTDNSRAVLEHLERSHFYVVALDDKRQWYRYHHLFADFLQHRLRMKYPQRVKELHQQASLWFERNGLQAEAIGHALAAGNHEHAAELVQDIAELLIWRRAELNTWLGWLNALPDAVVRAYPRLCLYHAWVLYLTNQMSGAERRVEDAEAALNLNGSSADPLIAGMLAAVRSTISGIRQQFPAALGLSRQALEQLPEGAVSWRCVAAINLGVTCATIGEADEAVGALSYAMELSQEIGSAFATLSSFFHLATLQTAQLRLHDAEMTCEQVLQLAHNPGWQRFPVGGYIALLLGEIMLERNELGTAERYLLESAEQINPEGFPMALLRTYVALSRLKTFQGDDEGVEHFFRQAEQLERMSRLQGRVSALSVYRARRWLARGNLDALERWAAENHLSVDDEFSYHREAHYLMLAHLYIASGDRLDEALYLLDRMVQRAESSRRTGSLIRALVLEAVALHAGGEDQSAVEALAHALALAEPEQPIRTFTDEGQSVAALLEKALAMQRKGQLAWRVSPEYAARLLAALGQRSVPIPTRRAVLPLVDALSEREMEVLCLLADGLESGEIAERLIIAVETARKHIKNIYSKLDVHSRWEAIKRAEELTLL